MSGASTGKSPAGDDGGRKQGRWSAIAWVWAALILAACWTPRHRIPVSEVGPTIPNLDKLIHFGLFAVFSGLCYATRAMGGRTGAIFVVGVALAVVSELGQATSFVNRDAGFMDGLADVLGIVACIAVVAILRRSRGPETSGPTGEVESPG